MNTVEKLEQSGIVKEKGTQCFKVHVLQPGIFMHHLKACSFLFISSELLILLLQDGKYKQASVQYKKIVSWLEHESGLSEEDEKKAKALRLAAHLNLAMCYLKMQEPSKALENCDKVLVSSLLP